MTRRFSPLAMLLVGLVTPLPATGCANNAKAPPSTTTFPPVTIITPTNLPPPRVVPGQIRVYRARVEPSLILLSGTAGLRDGTVLLSQLVEDGTPLSWWPNDTDIPVQNGQWAISVSLGQGASDRVRVGPSYVFNIHQKDGPSVKAHHNFDLVGPPAMQSGWSRVFSAIGGFFRALFRR